MALRDTKVIGFIAITSRTNVICTDVDACVVAGSEIVMKDHIAEIGKKNEYQATIKKARFGEIVEGMRRGGKYAFDKESYSRFYPLGKEIDMLLENPDFDNEEFKGKFFTVKLDSKNL
jgi:hypothetical protein